MSESDNEDDKFVKNVIHELSAFQKTDKSNEAGQQNEQAGKVETQSSGDPSQAPTETSAMPQGTGNNPSDGNSEQTTSQQNTADTTKQPSRIIRLSRPLNPYRGSRSEANAATAGSSTTTSVTASASSSSNSSATTGVSSTPGSRLAALQRPGSPMHRILQRAQSPALAAAAARMNRRSVGDSNDGTNNTSNSQCNNTSSDNSKDTNNPVIAGNTADNLGSTGRDASSRISRMRFRSSSSANYATKTNEESHTSASGDSDTKVDPTVDISNDTSGQKKEGGTQSRSVVPPRIQSSGLTSSILLRRPASPLRSSAASQLQLSKPNFSLSLDSSSPKSPPSDGQFSPRKDGQFSPRQINGPHDENQVSDRVAIRNKLRANSFRLKDLLTKKPTFAKSKEDNGEHADDSASQDSNDEKSKSGQEESKPESESRLMKTIGDSSDRTRWRREGLPTLTRSKSSAASARTATLISARYRRITPQNSAETAKEDSKSVVNTESTVVEDKMENKMSGNEVKDSDINTDTNSESAMTKDIKGIENRDTSGANDKSMTQTVSPGRSRVTVGATLIRSPRTRGNYSGNNVPSSIAQNQTVLDNKNEQQEKSGDINERTEVEKSDQLTEPNENEDRQLKALSDLEKESEANLVFDSQKIGQPECVKDDNESNNTIEKTTSPNRTKPYNWSQSEYQRPVQSETESAKHKINSEPSSPLKEQPVVRGSKSYDSTPDADFSKSSPSLKRCLAVTDLDQAMKDRDKEKLNLIFKDNSENDGAEEKKGEKEGVQIKTEGQSHTNDSQRETDLDARLLPQHRLTRSPALQQRVSHDNAPLSPPHSAPPHSAPPIQHVAPMVYKTNVNLEDAVKWPIDLPGKLDFRKMEVFEGQMLLNWLSSSIDKSHYLRLVMTKHDINVVACQVCTCMIAAGVMKQLESKEQESVFKTNCMYYWTHTQNTSTPVVTQDVNKITPMWPPTQEQTEDNRPGLKYTEADHQAAMVTLRHEYKEEVDTIQREHKGVLDKAREEYETRLQQAVERIALLQTEVEKYRTLAGIEKFAQNALSEADAAQKEAGLLLEGGHTNGFATPGSQYHTPMATPDGQLADFPLNMGKPGNDLLADLSMQDGTSGSESGSMGEGVANTGLAPPPAPPPPPGMPGIPPPAPPPPGSLINHKKAAKPPVKTINPMKPLFWQRIQVHEIKTPRNKEYEDKRLVWEEVEEHTVDITELDKLFSKTNIEPSRRFFNRPKNKAKQVAKVISPKRSQTIGILLSSLRIDMSEIEHAILTFDTSLIGEEKLRQIYENRGDSDELKKLREYIKKHPDTPLDKPDQFLYDLSLIPDYAERIFCFIFREAFQESVNVIETKMTNLRMTCQMLMTSIHVKRILGMVLALGNYMNGGSKSRGQADGFGVDILPKLKDVKSKDNATSLLHYTVAQYIKKFEGPDAGTEKVKYPLPDPSDLNQAAMVYFDELEKELRRIKTDFDAAEERADKVIKSANEHMYLQPFKDIMSTFFEKGRQEFDEQEENLADGKRLFQETVIFFCVKPRSGDKEVTPDYFFSQWSIFCQDFKDQWKREQQRLVKIRIKENEIRVKQIQQRAASRPVRRREKREGGLKDRLAKKGILES